MNYLSNSPLQVEITLLQAKSHISQHIPIEHLEKFYSYIEDVKDEKDEKLDGLIITGASVEQLDFEEVTYWDELKDINKGYKINLFED